MLDSNNSLQISTEALFSTRVEAHCMLPAQNDDGLCFLNYYLFNQEVLKSKTDSQRNI